MSLKLPAGMQINAPIEARFDEILTPDALAFVAKLHRAFETRRQELLKKRVERQARIDAGELPDFLPETKAIRDGDWKVAPLPKALGMGDALYFSFVTLATLGYGDFTPVSPVMRGLSVFEAIIGQLYLAILVARLVSLRASGGPPA